MTGRTKRVGVFGLGYVGTVSAVCLAARGSTVIGVDVSAEKVELLRTGVSPVVEENIGELTAQVVASGGLTVTTEASAAVRDTDISLVCVGTPSTSGGQLATRYLETVAAEIGTALGRKDSWHVVVFRSTMLPGTCEEVLVPLLENRSGKRVGVDFGVCVNPEYLREGVSVRDFFAPAKTVVGALDSRSAEDVLSLYDGLPGPRFQVPIRVAEMTKFVENSFHAVKVTFANEIGAVCRSLGLDSHAVMNIFLADTKLNLGPAYLRPGFAFGGSCLPKDLRALNCAARLNNVDTPLLAHVIPSNDAHLGRALDLVVADGRRNVGMFGLSFKPGTDDLRESPMVELANRLIEKGLKLKIYDANVSLSRLIGVNRAYLSDRIPHIGELLTDDVDAVVDHADILVIASGAVEVVDALKRASGDRLVIDLVRLPGAEYLRAGDNYRGIAW